MENKLHEAKETLTKYMHEHEVCNVSLSSNLTANHTLNSWPLHQDLLAPKPEESMPFQLLLGSSVTHSLLGKPPFRNSGSRVLRTREPYGHSPCNEKPRTPNCDVNGQCLRASVLSLPGYQNLRGHCLALQQPECRNADSTRTRHMGSTISGTPRYHVNLGTSRIASSRPQISCLWKPRMSGFRYSGFVPPVHPQINGLDQNREIALRDFNVHGIISLANSIRRCAMEIAPSWVYGLNPSQLLPDLTIQNPVSLLDDFKSPILFRCEEISAPPPCSDAASAESTSQ
jgi:hypothetical protein